MGVTLHSRGTCISPTSPDPICPTGTIWRNLRSNPGGDFHGTGSSLLIPAWLRLTLPVPRVPLTSSQVWCSEGYLSPLSPPRRRRPNDGLSRCIFVDPEKYGLGGLWGLAFRLLRGPPGYPTAYLTANATGSGASSGNCRQWLFARHGLRPPATCESCAAQRHFAGDGHCEHHCSHVQTHWQGDLYPSRSRTEPT